MNSSCALLIKRAQDGDSKALDELVADNVGLVRSVALRFTGRGVDYDDLCQIGHIGMIRAIRNFDLSRGTAFSTYAVPLIIGDLVSWGKMEPHDRIRDTGYPNVIIAQIANKCKSFFCYSYCRYCGRFTYLRSC